MGISISQKGLTNRSEKPASTPTKHLAQPKELPNLPESRNHIRIEYSSPTFNDDSEDSDDSIECTYCYCRRPAYGPMIACDNHYCQYEWFHYGKSSIFLSNPTKSTTYGLCFSPQPPGWLWLRCFKPSRTVFFSYTEETACMLKAEQYCPLMPFASVLGYTFRGFLQFHLQQQVMLIHNLRNGHCGFASFLAGTLSVPQWVE